MSIVFQALQYMGVNNKFRYSYSHCQSAKMSGQGKSSNSRRMFVVFQKLADSDYRLHLIMGRP